MVVKRRQLESPGVAAGERSVAAPAKNSSLRRDKNVVLEEEDQTDDKNKKQKNTAVLVVVAHLGIHDCRTSHEIAFKTLDSSIPDSQYRMN